MAKATRELYVELPLEDQAKHSQDKCGLLLRSMYGTQDASYNWQYDYSELLESAGFKTGKCGPLLEPSYRLQSPCARR